MRSPGVGPRTLIVTALIVAQPVLPSSAAGTAGTLDPSFGTGGRVVGTFYGWASAVALQPDGKIVVAGTADVRPGTFGFRLVRLNRDGTLDRSFGRSGKVITGIGDGAEATAVVVQADGKILAAGRSGPTGEGSQFFALARYLPDGELDRSFGRRGKVTTEILGGENGIGDLVLQPDGKIVAGGWTSPASALVYRFALARYRADGTLDRSFGSGGKVTTKLGNGSAGLAALALQPDGKIVAVGAVTRRKLRPSSLLVVARYANDGDLDAAFGSGGVVTTAFRGDTGASDVALQPDGRIVVAGSTASRRSGEYPFWSYFVTARYLGG